MKGQCLRRRNVDFNVTVSLLLLLNGSWYYDKNVLVRKYANNNWKYDCKNPIYIIEDSSFRYRKCDISKPSN